MTAPTNTEERHALRAIDVLNRTLAHRTDALTVAVAELAAVRGGGR